MTWQSALSEAMAAGQTDTAASIVLREVKAEQRRALEGRRPALEVRGALDGRDIAFHISGPSGSWRVSRSLADLADRADANPDIIISLLGAVAASAAERDHWGEEEWLPYGYIGAGSPPQPHVQDYVQTDRDVRINTALKHSDVLLIGRPASGKSASAAEAAMVRRVQYGDGIVWLDLTDPFDNAETVMLTLLRSPIHDRFLVVMDNLQANVSASREVLELVRKMRATIGLSVRVLATCWSAATALVDALPLKFTRIAADGGEVVHRLLADVPHANAYFDAFDRLASGDLVLARTALEHFLAQGDVPQPHQLADTVAARLKADQLTDVRAREALHWFACLGVFEIGVYRQYCAEVRPGWPIDDLRRRGLIRLVDEMYTVGHPSTAAALVDFANTHWNDPGHPYQPASRLAFEYLRRAGRPAIQATLEKLDLVNHGHAPHGDGHVLARVWPHRGVLTRYLRDQALYRDRTWNSNAGSAAFAAVALALLDQHEAWAATADYVRAQWSYSTPLELPRYVGPTPSADASDFVMIQQAMRAEDGKTGASEQHLRLSADNIDIDRFYRTWMLGILLTFENTAVGDDGARGAALIRIAEHHQLANGAFYPERVPWITARALNGLWHGNLTRHTSTMVDRACNWLRLPVEQGGPFDGRWHSGTGSWNSDVMTTAMCITALVHAGLGVNDPCVRSGYEYLKQQMPLWRVPGREIDCAAAAEAMLLVGPDQQEIYPVVVELLQWAGQWAGHGETPSAPGGEESVKIPYVAEQVIWIVQRIVERELEALLRDVAEPMPAAAAPAPEEASSTTTEPAASAEAAGRRAARLNGEAKALAQTEQHQLALEKLARIRREIEANIASRENALRGRGAAGRRPIQAQLDLWTGRGRRCDELQDEAQGAPVAGELAIRIEALFTEIFTAAE